MSVEVTLNSALFKNLDEENKFALFAWDRFSPSLPRFRNTKQLMSTFHWLNIKAFLEHLYILAQANPEHMHPALFAQHLTEKECVETLHNNPSLCFYYLFVGREPSFFQLPFIEISWFFNSQDYPLLTIPGFKDLYETVHRNLEQERFVNIFNKVRRAHGLAPLTRDDYLYFAFDQAILEQNRTMFHEVMDLVCRQK